MKGFQESPIKPSFRTFMRASLVCTMFAALVSAPVRNEVISSSAIGFVLQHSAEVAATPANAYRVAVRDIGRWWDKGHTYSGHSANPRLEAKAGGCLCERLDRGGSVQHLEVVYVQPGQTLRLIGGLGPLQELAAQGALTWQFKALDGDRTRITWTYRVTGVDAATSASLAPAVDQVIGTQIARLGGFIGTEKP